MDQCSYLDAFLTNWNSKYGIRLVSITFEQSHSICMLMSMDRPLNVMLCSSVYPKVGPWSILYSLHTSPRNDIASRHDLSFHLCANDRQLYVPFETSSLLDMEQKKCRLEASVQDIDS